MQYFKKQTPCLTEFLPQNNFPRLPQLMNLQNFLISNILTSVISENMSIRLNSGKNFEIIITVGEVLVENYLTI